MPFEPRGSACHNQAMKLTTSITVALCTLLPTVALACPSTASSCGGGAGAYASTFGVGIAAGILSIFLERGLRNRK